MDRLRRRYLQASPGARLPGGLAPFPRQCGDFVLLSWSYVAYPASVSDG
jgi:hypothetical protein